MITKIKKVYYCEYCKKKLMRKSSMENHERHCTANPNRECRLCDGNSVSDVIEKYKNSYKIVTEHGEFGDITSVVWKENKPITLEDIKKDIGYCPNCILTLLRCSGLSNPIFCINFDYKKELQEWWDEKNADSTNYI